MGYIKSMWKIEYTDEFGEWWESISAGEQVSLDASIRLLELLGPRLSRPHADTMKGSRHKNMKELRTQCEGRPLRSFFAFDPRRMAILLIGGDKTGDDQFYERMLPQADKLYDNHLQELSEEGSI